MRYRTGWKPRKRYNTYRRKRPRILLSRPGRKCPIRWRDSLEISRKWGALRRSNYWFKHKV